MFWNLILKKKNEPVNYIVAIINRLIKSEITITENSNKLFSLHLLITATRNILNTICNK
jgi:hypothetical protein